MKLIALAFMLCACRAVAGTDELFLCEAESCPAEGGGSAGGGGSGSCDEGEFNVTITVVGDIEVEVDSTDEQLTGGTTSRCLAGGQQKLRASCTSGNAEVAWGNESLCPGVNDTCEFSLTKDESFVVDGASACD